MGAALFPSDARYWHPTAGSVLGHSLLDQDVQNQLEVRQRMEDRLTPVGGKYCPQMNWRAANIRDAVKAAGFALYTFPRWAPC